MINLFSQYAKEELLKICRHKYDTSKFWHTKSTLIRIAGSVLGKSAVLWIRELWNKEEALGYELSQASIKSLPIQEAFELITAYLETVPPKELPRQAFACLNLCRSPIVLNWMEHNVKEHRDDWARLAASTSPAWSHMHQWISKGRPLSLIALETMVNCVPHPGDPYLSKLEPKIRETPSYRIVEEVLLDYEKLDSVPRVNTAIAYIQAQENNIFTGENFEKSKTFLGKLLDRFR